MILCLACALSAAACSGTRGNAGTAEAVPPARTGTEGEAMELKTGIYVLEEDHNRGPYVFFDTERGSWHCAAGIAVSFALGGNFRKEGDRILADGKNEGTDGTVIEFRQVSASEVTAVSVKKGFFPGDTDWIEAGKTYELMTLENTAFWGQVCPADEALAWSKENEATVFEGMTCTSGKEVWDTFYETVTAGKPASVLCAHYYTLDPEHVSPELYAQEKDSYPRLYFYLVEYDGENFVVTTRDSREETADSQETFRYLLHFTGDTPATAVYRHYDYYVLVDDPEATWEGIEAGLFSAVAGAGYRHCMVYKDMFD